MASAPRNQLFRGSIARPASAPVQRFADALAVASAWLGDIAGRYPFDVELFHLLLHAGLSRRSVAVGTGLAASPPLRPQRAELPHWVPASGANAEIALLDRGGAFAREEAIGQQFDASVASLFASSGCGCVERATSSV